jgi:negative regulator of sigma E activity
MTVSEKIMGMITPFLVWCVAIFAGEFAKHASKASGETWVTEATDVTVNAGVLLASIVCFLLFFYAFACDVKDSE